jgi:type I restriction enzyme S subunit
MRYKLAEIFDLQMGKTPSRNNLEYWGTTDNKWISISDLSQAGKYIYDTKEYLSDDAVKDSGIKIIPANTVVMSFKLSIGKIAIVSEDMYSNEAIMAFHDKHIVEMLPEYIYYMFRYRDWDTGTNKAVMGKTLNKATLSLVEVDICDIKRQKKIVEILDKVSAVIDGRTKELKKLDELIKARFVEMFGDPVSNGMGLPIAAMTEVCSIIDGDRGKNYPRQDEFTNVGYCLFLNAKNVTAEGFSFDNCMYITEEKDNTLHKGKLIRGDVVLTTRGTIGNLAFYDENVPFENVRINSGMVILRMKKNVVSEVFFIEQFKLQLQSIKEKIASGSAQPQLPISTMNKIKILLAPIDLQNQFAAFVQQVDKSKAVVQKSLDEVQLLFDSLMQEYFG